MRIVVADDSATARMFVLRCLDVLGYSNAEIIEADNGIRALAAVLEKKTDLLLSDLTMPNMDGMKLIKTLSEDELLDDMAIIVISSAGNPAKEKTLASYGASVIAKPISPAKLAAALAAKNISNTQASKNISDNNEDWG